MSVIDHFGKTHEAIVSRPFDAGAARRQFNISLAIIAVLAFVLGVAAFSMRAPAAKHARTSHATVTGPSDFRPDVFGHLVRP